MCSSDLCIQQVPVHRLFPHKPQSGIRHIPIQKSFLLKLSHSFFLYNLISPKNPSPQARVQAPRPFSLHSFLSTILTITVLHQTFAMADLVGIAVIIISVTSLAVNDVIEEAKTHKKNKTKQTEQKE